MFEQDESARLIAVLCAHVRAHFGDGVRVVRAAVCLPLAACSLYLPVLSVSVSICLRVYTVLA